MEAIKMDIKLELLKDCYHSDSNFISCFPKEFNNSIDKCLEKSLKEFESMQPNLDFYVVSEQNTDLGYFAIHKKSYLCTFFIKPVYRNKDNAKLFWKQIMNKAEFPLFTPMFERNPKALNFLKKQGGKTIYTGLKDNEMFQLLKFDGGLN